MSQRMTFLHPTQLGNQSSRPVTKPTDPTCKVWQPGGSPNFDMSIAPPLRMRVDMVSYLHACVVSPPK